MTKPAEVNAFLRSLQMESSEDASGEQVPIVVDTGIDQALLKRARMIGLFTTNSCVVPGWRIVHTLPIITARRVLGLNFWRDFLMEIRDAVGGRSKTAEAAFGQLESELFQELQLNAAAKKSHAVIGVQIQFGEISGGGKSQMFYAAAQGTPVIMEQVSQQLG